MRQPSKTKTRKARVLDHLLVIVFTLVVVIVGWVLGVGVGRNAGCTVQPERRQQGAKAEAPRRAAARDLTLPPVVGVGVAGGVVVIVVGAAGGH